MQYLGRAGKALRTTYTGRGGIGGVVATFHAHPGRDRLMMVANHTNRPGAVRALSMSFLI